MPPSRLLDPVARFFSRNPRQCFRCRSQAFLSQRRAASSADRPDGAADSDTTPQKSKNTESANPILEEYLKAKKDTPLPDVVRGGMSKNSIFDALDEERGAVDEGEGSAQGPTVLRTGVFERNIERMNNILDPDPKNRQRWERKMVIRQIQKRGRLTKAQEIKRTEREFRYKTPKSLKTSVKKLGMLARQIAGKPLDEAVLQMRFSKKRAAVSVREHLLEAKAKAVVERGMGLGKAEGRAGDPVEIELKDGTRKLIKDRTAIYIDQAWVTRGPFKKSLEYRARGRVNILRHPQTRLHVLLKEEATRIRESQERQKKLENRKLWLPLPDRPVTAQRQYPVW